jgi:Fur family iron response transcriptional regulator
MTQPRPTVPAARGTIVPSTQATTLPGRTDLNGCPWHDVKAKLRDVGLRPTRQRMALGWILFAKGDRHVTAEMLYEEATRAKVPVSLATVYNTLHQFTEVGLLRQVAVDGSKAYFDTNNSEHHHFFIEDQNDLMDIPAADVVVGKAPVPPEGYEIARIDVVVRLRRKR